MASFRHQAIPQGASFLELVRGLNTRFQQLVNFLQGMRRETDGRTVYEQELEVEAQGKGLILSTPDGTKRYRVSISNAGAVITTLL